MLLKVLSCVVLVFLGAQIVLAATNSDAAKILETFKAQEREMIFESDKVLLDEEDRSIISRYNRIGIYETIGSRVQSKREYLEQQNAKISGRVDSLQANVESLDADIKDLVFEVNKINNDIIETKNAIETNKKAIELLKTKIQNNSEILLEYLVYLYKKGEFVSTDNDIDNLKTILLSGENIDQLVNDLYFKNIIQVTGQQLIVKHRKFISDLYIRKIELDEQEDTLRALRKTGILEKGILDDKRQAKQRLLEVTQGQEELYQKYIDEKLEVERDIKIKELREQIKLNNTKRSLLERYNCEFVAFTQGQEKSDDFFLLSQQCQDINKIIHAESRLTGVVPENNPFEWPIEPYLGVSAYYRDQGYKDTFGTDHDAIDIIARQGTEIKAPMDGYVIYIQPPVNTGYAYVALKHSDGLVSLYGHINEVNVELYDYVKQGDVFALSGGEYGTNGAGILTTGPHLHFVVYENEEYVDPLEYLDLSYLAYNELPERYNFKYLTDFKTRKGYEFAGARADSSDRFKIEGATEIERQKFLLSTYGVGAFSQWDIWVDEAVAEGIDPTFIMCIGLAETTLGKYMKTRNNIGNVGNTDSGATRIFPTPRSGVRAIAGVFNNRYLGGYTEIQELSRYGNKTGPIYASSELNWHNNVTKCMSHVKGYFIPDNYSFRLE